MGFSGKRVELVILSALALALLPTTQLAFANALMPALSASGASGRSPSPQEFSERYAPGSILSTWTVPNSPNGGEFLLRCEI